MYMICLARDTHYFINIKKNVFENIGLECLDNLMTLQNDIFDKELHFIN